MPLTLRPKDTLLEAILDAVVAGNVVTDINQIAVLRQFAEGVAADLADLDYDLYTLLQAFYIGSASDTDLDTRGADMGLVRDPGQAGSTSVTYTRAPTWIDDILLPAPQVLEATLTDGTVIVYRSQADVTLEPQGRSLSGTAPATSVTGGTNDQLRVNLDGDGNRTITLGSQASGVAIATAIQTLVRALTAVTPGNQPAYAGFRCDYSVTTPGAYTLRSGTTGTTSTVVVTDATTHNGTVVLKLGTTHGGTERAGMTTVNLAVLCDTVGALGNINAGQLNTQQTEVAGVLSVSNPLAVANGREPASDDAYRQDLRSYLLALGRGTRDALERAVYATVSSTDGLRHVLSAQVAYGVGSVEVYVCDGRSLTVGAQTEVIQDVQDELDGNGPTIGGWLPAGVVAGVAAATVLNVNVAVTVALGPTPDLTLAQQAITTAIYATLYGWPVGQALSYAQLTRVIDNTVVEMLGVTYTSPTVFTTAPPTLIPAVIGEKLMPGTITVGVVRA